MLLLVSFGYSGSASFGGYYFVLFAWGCWIGVYYVVVLFDFVCLLVMCCCNGFSGGVVVRRWLFCY